VFISALLAPIRMLIHSKFVAVTLLGGDIGWTPPSRKERETGWKAAIRFHGAGSLLALVWGAVVFWINPGFFWWISPILVPLFLAVPISVVMSRTGVGQCLRRWGLFLAPPEQAPPPELAAVKERLRKQSLRPPLKRTNRRCGFARAVVEPEILCLHGLARRGERRLSASILHKRQQLIEKALDKGPGALSGQEKRHLLNDVASLRILHERVWALPDGERAHHWGL
jgi:membrane glycosyltransferase